MSIRNADLIGALASLVASAITDDGKLSVGHTGDRSIIHVTHQEDRHEAIFRTDNGEAWIVRAAPLGKHMNYNGNDDANKVHSSFAHYEGLVESKNHAMRFAKSLGIDDEDLALQSWHDDVLNDAERETWARWSPGGYASDAEWAIVGRPRKRKADQGDGMPGMPRVDADEMN